MATIDNVQRQRTRLNFAHAVRQRFAFLEYFGFAEVESQPTLVRYRNEKLEVTLYHGRQSFELGFEIGCDGSSYSISELIGVSDAEAAKHHRNFAATTSAGIVEGLNQVAELVMRYGDRALRGDRAFFGKRWRNHVVAAEGARRTTHWRERSRCVRCLKRPRL